MKYVFGIVGVLSLLASLGMCTMAKGATHEATGSVFLVVAVLAFGFEALIEVIQRLNKDIQEQFFHLGKFLKEHVEDERNT
jgi:hypothetical protein